jgi:hypothetical protein
MTLQDALVAYRTYARAEGKSPKTVDWVVFSVGYFAKFLGPRQQDIGTIKGNDLRRFIIALQEKPKFANHPYNKPQPVHNVKECAVIHKRMTETGKARPPRPKN